MSSVVRSTALRAGGACVRCRKGKTKCVYENGRAPCKNCAKGMHECYLPSESMSHGGHGVSPARIQQRARESLPSERAITGTSGERQGPPPSSVSRHVSTSSEKYVDFLSSVLALAFQFAFRAHFRLLHFPFPVVAFFERVPPVGSIRALSSGTPWLPRSAETAFSSAVFSEDHATPHFLRPASFTQTVQSRFPLLRAFLPVTVPLTWPLRPSPTDSCGPWPLTYHPLPALAFCAAGSSHPHPSCRRLHLITSPSFLVAGRFFFSFRNIHSFVLQTSAVHSVFSQ